MTNANQPGTKVVQQLRALDAATLFESGASATMGPEIRMLSGDSRLAGPALTVVCPPGDNLMIHLAVARAKAGALLVVQSHDPAYGVWGEVLTVAAMARGIAGLVLDGSVRDLGAIAVWAFRSSPEEQHFQAQPNPLAVRSAWRRPAAERWSGRKISSSRTRVE